MYNFCVSLATEVAQNIGNTLCHTIYSTEPRVRVYARTMVYYTYARVVLCVRSPKESKSRTAIDVGRLL